MYLLGIVYFIILRLGVVCNNRLTVGGNWNRLFLLIVFFFLVSCIFYNIIERMVLKQWTTMPIVIGYSVPDSNSLHRQGCGSPMPFTPWGNLYSSKTSWTSSLVILEIKKAGIMMFEERTTKGIHRALMWCWIGGGMSDERLVYIGRLYKSLPYEK